MGSRALPPQFSHRLCSLCDLLTSALPRVNSKCSMVRFGLHAPAPTPVLLSLTGIAAQPRRELAPQPAHCKADGGPLKVDGLHVMRLQRPLSAKCMQAFDLLAAGRVHQGVPGSEGRGAAGSQCRIALQKMLETATYAGSPACPAPTPHAPRQVHCLLNSCRASRPLPHV